MIVRFFKVNYQPGVFSTVQMRQSEKVVNERGVPCKTPPLSGEDTVRNNQTVFEEKLSRENEENRRAHRESERF